MCIGRQRLNFRAEVQHDGYSLHVVILRGTNVERNTWVVTTLTQTVLSPLRKRPQRYDMRALDLMM